MRKRSTRSKTVVQAFSAGAGCGFLAGALVAAALLSRYGNVIREYTGEVPAATERWRDTVVDDRAIPNRRAPNASRPVATSGLTPDVVPPPSSPEAVLSAPPAEELADRDLILPVEGVTTSQLIRSFNETRNGRQHEAIDIRAPQHTPVKAVEDGRVVRLFYSKAGGNTIYQFDPSERFCYYYAHLDRYAEGLAEGQQVRRGQILGYVGVSGNAPKDTPHLHFAIFRLSSAKRWWEGTPIDPYGVLK